MPLYIFACEQGQPSQDRVEICLLIPFSDQGRQSKSALTRSSGHTYEQCLSWKVFIHCARFCGLGALLKAEDEYLARKSE